MSNDKTAIEVEIGHGYVLHVIVPRDYDTRTILPISENEKFIFFSIIQYVFSHTFCVGATNSNKKGKWMVA